MPVLLVTYDLHKPGQDYSGVHKTIKSYPYAKLSESSYAIETAETPADIYGKVSKDIDKDDRIYIINLKRQYAGFGLQEVNEWLESRLQY